MDSGRRDPNKRLRVQPPLEITNAEIAAAEEALSELLRPPAADQQLEFTDAEIAAAATAEKVLSKLPPEEFSELLMW